MSQNIEQELLKQGLLKTVSYVEKNTYSLLRDSYFGSGGFLSGSYLLKSATETEPDYVKRKSISNYRNIMKPVIDSLNDPIFSHDLVRDLEKSGNVFQAFVKDADSSGEHLDSVIQEIDLKAEILGSVFCFMDNYTDVPTLEKDEIAQRKFPYIYTVEPDKVASYAFNNLGALIFVKFNKDNDSNGMSLFQSFYIVDGVWVTVESRGDGERGEEIESPAPFLYKTSKKYDKNLLPLSSHIDTATSARILFNQNSLINKQQFANTFNFLAMKGTKGDMKIGVDRVLFVPKDGDYPEFISPNTDTMDTIGKDRDDIQSEIAQVNNLSIQNSNIAQSGDSKRWNDKKRQEKLSSKVKGVLQLEQWVVTSFSFFSKTDIEANVTYNESFDFFTISEDLDDIIKMIEANFTKDSLNEARALFVGKLFNQLEKSDEFQENERNNKNVSNVNDEIIEETIDKE